MKKDISDNTQIEDDDMLPEYDFSNAVRGKHYHPLHEGYTVKIHKADGTTEVQEIQPAAGTVKLEPDVQAYFPDSQAVNRALRSLIAIMDQVPRAPKKTRTSQTKKQTVGTQ